MVCIMSNLRIVATQILYFTYLELLNVHKFHPKGPFPIKWPVSREINGFSTISGIVSSSDQYFRARPADSPRQARAKNCQGTRLLAERLRECAVRLRVQSSHAPVRSLKVFFPVAVFLSFLLQNLSRNMEDTRKKKRPLIAARERGELWEVQVGCSHGE